MYDNLRITELLKFTPLELLAFHQPILSLH